MSAIQGIILIDQNLILVKIYQEVEQDSWQILLEDSVLIEDVKTIIEKVANIFVTYEEFGINDWSVFAMQLADKVVIDIQGALDISIERLTIKQEYSYIFKSLIQKVTRG